MRVWRHGARAWAPHDARGPGLDQAVPASWRWTHTDLRRLMSCEDLPQKSVVNDGVDRGPGPGDLDPQCTRVTSFPGPFRAGVESDRQRRGTKAWKQVQGGHIGAPLAAGRYLAQLCPWWSWCAPSSLPRSACWMQSAAPAAPGATSAWTAARVPKGLLEAQPGAQRRGVGGAPLGAGL